VRARRYFRKTSFGLVALLCTMEAGRAADYPTRPVTLVVAFTPPLDGHCHKVVAGLLPRP